MPGEALETKDFFVSYTGVNEAWATWIGHTLELAGYTVVLQCWDFRPGHNFVLEMERAIKSCRRTILVLSREYLEAMFTQPEYAAAFAADPTGVNRKLIPVKVDDCSPGGILKQVVWIDLSKTQELQSMKLLLDGVLDGRTRLGAGQILFPGPGGAR